jgi:hypothetical protein
MKEFLTLPKYLARIITTRRSSIHACSRSFSQRNFQMTALVFLLSKTALQSKKHLAFFFHIVILGPLCVFHDPHLSLSSLSCKLRTESSRLSTTSHIICSHRKKGTKRLLFVKSAIIFPFRLRENMGLFDTYFPTSTSS